MSEKCCDTQFVIMRDDDPAVYFIRVGLGIFWECSDRLRDAKRFTTRSQAARVLIRNGKNRLGWYIEATDRLQGLADSGVDTWEDYRGDANAR